MTIYSRPATEFQKTIRQGALFRVFDEPDYLPLRGQVLMIYDTLKVTANPDDWLYRVKDSAGELHEVRSGWLRRNSARVD